MTALGPRGSRLLASLTAHDETLQDEGNPMREVALSAARTADRLARLEDLAATVDPWVETKAGLATHPVMVEVRQQAQLLSRLIAALRLPDPQSGKRPQARPPRGAHAPARVTSLEKARMAAEGSAS